MKKNYLMKKVAGLALALVCMTTAILPSQKVDATATLTKTYKSGAHALFSLEDCLQVGSYTTYFCLTQKYYLADSKRHFLDRTVFIGYNATGSSLKPDTFNWSLGYTKGSSNSIVKSFSWSSNASVYSSSLTKVLSVANDTEVILPKENTYYLYASLTSSNPDLYLGTYFDNCKLSLSA